MEKVLEVAQALQYAKTPKFAKMASPKFTGAVIQALEKQLPKKPVQGKLKSFFSVKTVYLCPVCREKLNPTGKVIDSYARKEIYHHCKCGQLFDWEGVKE